MGFADDLVAHLDSNSTKVAAGTSIRKHSISESTGRCVFVLETPGLPPVQKFSARPAISRPRAQVMIRSTKAVGGGGIPSSTATRDLAGDMWDLCDSVTDTNMNSNRYLRVECLQDVFQLRIDEAGRQCFAFNVEALRAFTTQA